MSAQQARERKKAYLSDLETRVKELEKKNSELEERLSTLQNENQMLRNVCTSPPTIPYHSRIIIMILTYIIVSLKGHCLYSRSLGFFFFGLLMHAPNLSIVIPNLILHA